MLKPELIGKISSISSVLEVSGYPKPGTVHETFLTCPLKISLSVE